MPKGRLVTGAHGCQSAWLWGSQVDQVQPQLLTKSRGGAMSSGETRKEFIL